MLLARSLLLSISTLLIFNTAHAVKFIVDAPRLGSNDGVHLNIGYLVSGKESCELDNIIHGVYIKWGRHGYEYSTPVVTPQTVNRKICATVKCDDLSGIKCGPGNASDTYWIKPVKNSPDCEVKLHKTDKDDWDFQYNGDCG